MAMANDSFQQQINNALAALAAEKLKLEGMLTQPHPPGVIAQINKVLENLNAQESQLRAVRLESEIVAIRAQAFAAAEKNLDQFNTDGSIAKWMQDLVKELGEEIEGMKNE